MKQQEMIYQLNRLLANYFVIYVKLHRYTWYAKGDHVFLLQTLFKELSNDIKLDIDHLAEYILAVGGKPFATMIKFVKEADIEEATADDEEPEMIAQLHHDFDIMNEHIESLLSQSDETTTYFLFPFHMKIKKYRYRFNAYKEKS